MKQKKDRDVSIVQDRETIGKIATDLAQKEPETTDPIEMQRAVHSDYNKHFYECVERGKKEYSGDFYVVVSTKAERLLKNVLRNLFFCRSSCPTPTYDQTVYKYHRASEQIEFLWVVPSEEASHHLKFNAVYVHPDERKLLSFVLDFYDGTLDKRTKELNNEL